MTFNVTRNCHKVSNGAVTKQERKSAILNFVFLVFPEEGQLNWSKRKIRTVFNLRGIPKKKKHFGEKWCWRSGLQNGSRVVSKVVGCGCESLLYVLVGISFLGGIQLATYCTGWQLYFSFCVLGDVLFWPQSLLISFSYKSHFAIPVY